jgi:hypothetical protein
MVKSIVMIALVMFAVSSYAMVYIEENFESGTLDNVTTTDDDGDGNSWQIMDTGDGYLAESVSEGLTPDNSMYLPSTFVELDTYLSFYVGASGTEHYSEHFAVYMAIDYMGLETFVTVWEATLDASEMKKVEIELKPYLQMIDEWFYAENITVWFRHFDSDGQSSLLIDDPSLIYYPTFSYNEGLETSHPQSAVEPYSSVFIKVWPYDMSYFDYENDWEYIGTDQVYLHYIISDRTGFVGEEQVVQMTISSDPNSPESFESTVDGMAMGTYMEYWAEATDNSDLGLVGKSEHFFLEWGEINFDEGFEYPGPEIYPPDGWMPEGWVSFQTGTPLNSYDQPWAVDIAGQNVRTGKYSVTSESQNNWGQTETINYMVSKRLRVNGTPTLKYFVNLSTKIGEEFTERWSVLISTVEGSGTDIENFVELKTDSIVPIVSFDESWIEKTLYLGDYEDEYVRIMWKHKSTVITEKLDRHLSIDDISIAEMPVMAVQDPGNAEFPDVDFPITVTATDYSGINNVTIYYTIPGFAEMSSVMTDNGNDTFTGYIPGQPENTKCSWYVVVTDNSAFANTTSSVTYDLIWLSSGILEWGSTGTGYTDEADYINGGDRVAMDWNFGTKGYLYLNKIEVGWGYDANNLEWSLVEFDGIPTNNVIGDLQGVHNFLAGGDTLHIENGKNTPISGHVALVFRTPEYNEIMLDESGDKSHAWQWNDVLNWTTNLWGAFYIKMYVSQIPNGIEDEFVSSTTELCQNYPNPFNPTTSISFYNRVAGDVSLTVYNTKGEKVASLINEKLNEGFRRVDFNASGINSGVYYYTLKTPEKTLTRKMVLIK